MISTNQFLDAFSSEWESRITQNKNCLMSAYGDNRAWTDYMLSYGGFLHAVMKRLSGLVDRLDYSKEIYTIDAMFVGGEDMFRENLCYPSKLYALIEHEHGENLEEEMWKLIFWRAPLKVLIFYDWNEDQKTTSNRKEWASNKLSFLMGMRDKANSLVKEPEETEYLFLFANRHVSGGDVVWHWASNKAMEATLVNSRAS